MDGVTSVRLCGCGGHGRHLERLLSLSVSSTSVLKPHLDFSVIDPSHTADYIAAHCIGVRAQSEVVFKSLQLRRRESRARPFALATAIYNRECVQISRRPIIRTGNCSEQRKVIFIITRSNLPPTG